MRNGRRRRRAAGRSPGGRRGAGPGLALGFALFALGACESGDVAGGRAASTGPPAEAHDLTGNWFGSYADELETGIAWFRLSQDRGRFAGVFNWKTSTGTFAGDIEGWISGALLVGTLGGTRPGGCWIRVDFDGTADREPGEGVDHRIVARYAGDVGCLGPTGRGRLTMHYGHP